MANIVIKKFPHARQNHEENMKVTINKNGSKDDGDLVKGMKQKDGRVTRPDMEK